MKSKRAAVVTVAEPEQERSFAAEVAETLSAERRREIAVEALLESVHGFGYNTRYKLLKWLRQVRKAHFGLELHQLTELGVMPKWAGSAVAYEVTRQCRAEDLRAGLKEQLDELSWEQLQELNQYVSGMRLQERYSSRIPEKHLTPAVLRDERAVKISKRELTNWVKRSTGKRSPFRPQPMQPRPPKKRVKKHVVTVAEYARNLKRQLAALGNTDFSTRY